ncbi:sodium-coupled monocarboxylate transporter 1 [Ornithorhynchus anatinus]|uniref:Solute carrier family 5 member 8 n=1 Tax=Ornithorhynchus anatinus TaxID=9258 RepID=A0A6I8NZG6_ORNAN|nr:sodium-coupled monocarboxylate transporter 1 [Ornithorhynchus anatinus]
MRRKNIGAFVVWDYLVFALMLLISALIGVYYAFAGGGQKTRKDFLMGGRGMSAVPVAMSLTASFMSAVTVLGTPAEVYRFGIMFGLFFIAYTLMVIVSAEIFLPVFYRLGITSTYEYLELRFNKHVRRLGTVLFIIQTVLYTGIVIYAPALALNQVTGFELWGAVVTTGLVCTFYCTLGGLKAVIWTDVFQIGIMIAGFLSVIIQTAVIQGGMGNVLKHARLGGRLRLWDFNPDPMQRHTFWTLCIGGTFTWAGIYGVNQSQVQRYLSCKTRYEAKLSLYINLVSLYIILSSAVFSGLSLYSVYRECDPWTSKKVSAPDQLMPYLVLDIFREFPGMPGLFVACAYSATLSTVSSSINALAAVTVEDIIEPHLRSPSEYTLSWFSKGTSVFYGVFCIGMAGLASLMGALLQAALSIFGIIGGPLLGLFSLGILFPFANPIGAFGGLLGGFLMSLWVGIGSQLYPPPPWRTLPLTLSTAGCNQSQLVQRDWNDMIYSTNALQVNGVTRTPIMDNWYSLSYLYLSTLGTVSTVIFGVIISLLTGGRHQDLDRKLLLNKGDLTRLSSLIGKRKSQVEVSKQKSQISEFKEMDASVSQA